LFDGRSDSPIPCHGQRTVRCPSFCLPVRQFWSNASSWTDVCDGMPAIQVFTGWALAVDPSPCCSRCADCTVWLSQAMARLTNRGILQWFCWVRASSWP
jgi:hypothetical protein